MHRGDVHRFEVTKENGHEQRGARFGVVVQAEEFLPRSAVLVTPTSRSARPASFRAEVVVRGEATRVLVEHVGAVDVTRLGARVGHLEPAGLRAVDEALATVLGLD